MQKLQNFGPSYNVPKSKRQNTNLLTKILSSGARLWNGKELDTHSAQTESSLLDSNDYHIPFCMMLNDMCNTHDKHLTKLIQKNLSYEYALFLKKNQIHFERLKKGEIWLTKKIRSIL